MKKLTDEDGKLFLKTFPIVMFKLWHDFSAPDVGIKLNRTHWRALFILWHSNRPNMSRMCEIMNIERGSFTTVVDYLIKHNLVERIRDNKDRRMVYLQLNEDSKNIVKKGIEAKKLHLSKKIEKLSENDTQTLMDSLRRITSIVEKL